MKIDGHVHTPFCPHGSSDLFEQYIEKAIMNQASRLASISGKDIAKELLFILKEEDFMEEDTIQRETDKRKIGFV